uniref:Uncharacterized protein n=1 Tax=Cannabis sativa TaxID=3483 RepID=A0A803Q404_CANSA
MGNCCKGSSASPATPPAAPTVATSVASSQPDNEITGQTWGGPPACTDGPNHNRTRFHYFRELFTASNSNWERVIACVDGVVSEDQNVGG